MEELTDRQRAILQFITQHIVNERFPPTIREIGLAMGIRSTNGVNDHLKALERKGCLERGEMKSRALIPTAEGWHAVGIQPPAAPGAANDLPPPRTLRAVAGGKSTSAAPTRRSANLSAPALHSVGDDDLIEIPLLGRVAAGAPILAEENRDSTIRIDPSLLGRRRREEIFALRVKGDSMIGDGIFDGDTIFVRQQHTARPGEIVVAMIEGEATVKRFYPEGDRIRLQPSNPELQPIYVRRREGRAADILGLVVGVFRQLG